jgi:hypothetical protein
MVAKLLSLLPRQTRIVDITRKAMLSFKKIRDFASLFIATLWRRDVTVKLGKYVMKALDFQQRRYLISISQNLLE